MSVWAQETSLVTAALVALISAIAGAFAVIARAICRLRKQRLAEIDLKKGERALIQASAESGASLAFEPLSVVLSLRVPEKKKMSSEGLPEILLHS
ncbi:MAG: hypothetical protein ACHQ50_10860 [Fimbriimonadales bacterium]